MPYTVSNPPKPATNWTQSEKEKCVRAANAVLDNGGSEEDAIYACIAAAGKSDKSENNMDMIRKSFPVEVIKADETKGIIEAIVAVMGNIDYGDDVVHTGAFTKTLTERGNKVKVLDNHNSNSVRDVIGKPITIREIGENELPPSIKLRYPASTGGLYTITQFDMNDDHSKTIFNKLANGFVDEWSIGFTIPKGKSDYSTSENRTVRNIRELVLFEYSPVIWAMNDATSTLGAKNMDENEQKRQSLIQTYIDISDAFNALYMNYENYTGFCVTDVFSDYTLIAKSYNMQSEYEYYQIRWQEIDNQYVFDPIENWLGGNFAFVVGMKHINLNLENKQGRVLNQRNFDKLTSCREMIDEILKSAMPMMDGEDMPDMMDDEDKNIQSDIIEGNNNNSELANPVTQPVTKDNTELLRFFDTIINTTKQ